MAKISVQRRRWGGSIWQNDSENDPETSVKPPTSAKFISGVTPCHFVFTQMTLRKNWQNFGEMDGVSGKTWDESNKLVKYRKKLSILDGKIWDEFVRGSELVDGWSLVWSVLGEVGPWGARSWG